MKHDEFCELVRGGKHCQCGSRACPLCDGCRDGLHLEHEPMFARAVRSIMAHLECACPACETA